MHRRPGSRGNTFRRRKYECRAATRLEPDRRNVSHPCNDISPRTGRIEHNGSGKRLTPGINAPPTAITLQARDFAITVQNAATTTQLPQIALVKRMYIDIAGMRFIHRAEHFVRTEYGYQLASLGRTQPPRERGRRAGFEPVFFQLLFLAFCPYDQGPPRRQQRMIHKSRRWILKEAPASTCERTHLLRAISLH